MNRIFAKAERAARGLVLVKSLQQHFVHALEEWGGVPLTSTEWFRDSGLHGGGIRYGAGDTDRLARASVNVSQVHYEDEPSRPLGAASALSAIVHPAHPQQPSAHIHISWTELKSGTGYWRIMADLNPAIPNDGHTRRFAGSLKRAAPESFALAEKQGARYFFIPALGRQRGVVHFYLDNFCADDYDAGFSLAQQVGEAAVDTYMELLRESCASASAAEYAAQLSYHTLYCFQVLTLDRGTTAGLLVHDQNDIGILGSLPPRVDRALLASWQALMEEPQDQLLSGILSVLPNEEVCTIDDEVKLQLANVLRRHYRLHPEALDLQAAGSTAPPALTNHQGDDPFGASRR